ncbi:GuaB3 family IMP dehydrogenase-related protein [Corynebacterium kroppenstedtii]|uniref:GuaB3 family IMP dehydrogenase-related protein n=1 Tax=Corynebacterium sp. PCR 32 TaxID=3351342 RepID=UPI0030ABB219
MREVVEIGLGREARRTYGLDDITIVPNRRTRSSKDVDTSWTIDAYRFGIPVLAQPSDALTSVGFIGEMGRLGGAAVINAEGLWGRMEDMDSAVGQIVSTALDDEGYDDGQMTTRAIPLLQHLHGLPLDKDLLSDRIRDVRASGVTTVVRVSPQNARELAPVVVAAGAEIVVIQGTLISAEHVSADGTPLNLKEFIGSLDVPVIAGSVLDYTTALHLMRTGAAGIIVGGGSTTNADTLGIDAPKATAIADAAAARRDYLDETGGRYVHVIADCELETSGEMAKAIACGADAVMLGSPLSQAKEAAATGYYWPSVAAHPRFPRGEVETLMVGGGEAPSLETVLMGPATDPFGSLNLIGGVRRSMAKAGYTSLKDFQKVQLSVRSWL